MRTLFWLVTAVLLLAVSVRLMQMEDRATVAEKELQDMRAAQAQVKDAPATSYEVIRAEHDRQAAAEAQWREAEARAATERLRAEEAQRQAQTQAEAAAKAAAERKAAEELARLKAEAEARQAVAARKAQAQRDVAQITREIQALQAIVTRMRNSIANSVYYTPVQDTRGCGACGGTGKIQPPPTRSNVVTVRVVRQCQQCGGRGQVVTTRQVAQRRNTSAETAEIARCTEALRLAQERLARARMEASR